MSSEQITLGECSFYWLKTEITQIPTNAEQANKLTFFHLSTPCSLKLKLQKIHTKTSYNIGVAFNQNSDNVLLVEDFY